MATGSGTAGNRQHRAALAALIFITPALLVILKRAIISDIHGNLEALTAVLAHLNGEADEIFCLGDIVGYGPNPNECLDLVIENCKLVILGNHDQGALFDPEGFSSNAERAIFWTRRQIENGNSTVEQRQKRLEFLCRLPRNVVVDDYMFVHGSARNPLNEYVFPDDAAHAQKMEKIFKLIPHYCFQGHTHVPGVFLENNRFLSPTDLEGGTYSLGSGKAMVNVGSVGQPRDGDPRACYITLEDNQIQYHRVEYDFRTTSDKIHQIDELDNFLGDRLGQGR